MIVQLPSTMKRGLTGLLFFAISVLALRGVLPENEAYYNEGKDQGVFTCISDGKVIPFKHVNDGYCDCADGSDEPGTSGCSNGKFYCKNEGFFSKLINSNLVDDGICDCCDGSDELPGVCPNTCTDLMNEYIENAKESNGLIQRGLRLKNEMISTSQAMKDELLGKIGSIQSSLNSNEFKHSQLLEMKDELVRIEQNGPCYDHLHEKLNNLQNFIETQLNKVNSFKSNTETLEKILGDMNEKYNHNFNDPAVKLASQNYLNYKSNKETQEIDFKQIISSINDLKNEIDNLPVPKVTSFWHPIQEFSNKLVYSFIGIKPKNLEKLSLPEVEQKLDILQNKINTEKTNLEKMSNTLNRDFGPNDILRSLNDKFESEIGNYKYSIQLNGDLIQNDNKGSSVTIGRFKSVVMSSDGEHFKLNFGDGQRCWNGPIRSASIGFECNTQTSIKIVNEPEKCHYYILVDSPLGCFENDLIVI